MPKISVIVPVYKVETFLHKCVNSILAQTFTDFELILVDDGSPDNCGKICDEYAEKDDRITVIHQKNGGLSSARNAGLNIANGDYVFFVDSDDYIELNAIDSIMRHVKKEYDMISFSANVVDENGYLIDVFYYEPGTFLFSEDSDRISFIFGQLFAGRTGWEAWNRIYRRNIIEEHHLRFADNKTVFAEDLYFCLCYCFYANNILIIENRLYNYRIRANSIMRDNGNKLNVGRMNELSKSVYELVVSDVSLEYIKKVFPGIHMCIIDNSINHFLKSGKYPLKELRNRILDDVKDQKYFFSKYHNIRKFYKYLSLSYNKWALKEKLSFIQYLKDNNYLLLCLRNRMIHYLIRFKPN